MNIQIYVSKKNPDVLKAERFFKERRIPYQLMDLKKHKLGQKELDTFIRAVGAQALVDREGKKALERPVAHMSDDRYIAAALLDDPSALRTPIVRNGAKVTVGADEETWKQWVEAGK
ncbi:MAG: ArsC family transcriptional regulator [Clostridia bacterium]|nr:ArsC family transcriptional regulator [Clostridia bacterium]